MKRLQTLLLLLPLAMCILASSFVTWLVISGGHDDGVIWAYGVAMVALTVLNLWAERRVHRR